MTKVTVAVIGLNYAANTFHLPGLSQFPDVELSLCDIREDRLRAAGERFGVPEERQYVDYRQMLTKADPMAVCVLMAQYPGPDYDAPRTYSEIVLSALAQKRHVLVEKPLAMTVEEAAPLVEGAEKAGTVTMCSFNRRFCPAVQFAKRKVEERGPILDVGYTYCKHAKAWSGVADILSSDMVHGLDLMRYLMGGKVVEFHSFKRKTERTAHFTAFHAMALSDNGAAGTFYGNAEVGARIETLQVHGRDISAYAETDLSGRHTASMIVRVLADSDRRHALVHTDVELAGSADYVACLGFAAADRYFVECVKSGQQPHCNFADAYETQSLCQRILKGD